jgi:Carboxypeptidase regulatory-like domain
VVLRRSQSVARGATQEREAALAPKRKGHLFGLSLPFLAMLAIVAILPATAAAASGSITGTVTAASGGAGLGATVTLYEDGDYSDPIATTTADPSTGIYTFTGLSNADYELEFTDSGYIMQYYDNEPTEGDADSVCVASVANFCSSTAQPAPTGIDAALVAGGATLTGTVTAAAGGAGLNDATVALFDADEVELTQTTTGPSGEYTFSGLPAGSYFAEFSDDSADYIPQYYDGESSQNASDPITVASGASATASGALTMGGSITGTVADSSGTGVTGIQACAYDDQDSYGYGAYGCATSGSGGTYTIPGLPTGAYKIEFTDPSNTYLYTWYGGTSTSGASTPVNVTAPNTTTATNTTLQASSSAGSISGTVTAGSQPVSDVPVYLYDAGGNELNEAYETSTAADGTYSFTGLLPGTYKVWFAPETNLAWQFYSGQPTMATANTVTVGTSQNVQNINAALVTGGKITGTVTDAATKAPVADVGVEVLDSTGFLLGYTTTDPSGSYALAGIPTGSYEVEFVPLENVAAGGLSYADQYYSNADTLQQATKVSVTAPSTTGSINAALTTSAAQTPAQVTNTVTNTVTGPTVTNTVTVVQTPPTVSGKVSVSKKGKASLSFTLKAGSNMPDIQSFTVKLPGGISFDKKKLKKALSVKSAKYSYKLSKGKLVVTLKSGVSSVKLSVGSKGLTVSKALAKKAKAGKTGTLTVHVASTNVDKKTTNLSYS